MRSSLAAVLLFFAQLLFSPLLMPGLPPSPEKAVDALPSSEAAVEAVLRTQQDAWNRHDLEAFMAGYWNSPELTFFSGATETKGWQPTLDRYRQRYQSNGNAMGTLSFSDLKVEALGVDSAFVRGRFHLVMPDGKQPAGVFTLIFRKF